MSLTLLNFFYSNNLKPNKIRPFFLTKKAPDLSRAFIYITLIHKKLSALASSRQKKLNRVSINKIKRHFNLSFFFI